LEPSTIARRPASPRYHFVSIQRFEDSELMVADFHSSDHMGLKRLCPYLRPDHIFQIPKPFAATPGPPSPAIPHWRLQIPFGRPRLARNPCLTEKKGDGGGGGWPRFQPYQHRFQQFYSFVVERAECRVSGTDLTLFGDTVAPSAKEAGGPAGRGRGPSFKLSGAVLCACR